MQSEVREIEDRLRPLAGVRAPVALLPAVMAAIRESAPDGIAEGAPEGVPEGAPETDLEGDFYARVETPLKPILVAWNRAGISAVGPGWTDGQFESWYLARAGRPVRRRPLPPPVARAIEDWLDGRPTPGLRLDLGSVTDFERAVLGKTLEIPRGEVRTYAWVAREIGRPRAVRAVGTALSHNPIPYLIPCHRVVRSDGKIGNYSGGGPDAKRAILAFEGASSTLSG